MKIDVKELNELVMLTALNLGWEVWFVESVPRAGGKRRIRYSRNGWEPGEAVRSKIEKALRAKLQKNDNIVSMGWGEAETFRGPMPWFAITIQEVPGEVDPNIKDEIATERGKLAQRVFSKPLYVYEYGDIGPAPEKPQYGIGRELPRYPGPKNYKKLTVKQSEKVKAAIGPKRLNVFLKKGYTLVPKAVYDKLMGQ